MSKESKLLEELIKQINENPEKFKAVMNGLIDSGTADYAKDLITIGGVLLNGGLDFIVTEFKTENGKNYFYTSNGDSGNKITFIIEKELSCDIHPGQLIE